MGCCDEDSVRVSKMALELKSGPMLWYKRRFFGSNWRDVHSVLYNDSSLLWYRDKSRQDQMGGLVLKEAPELIAFGVYTSQVPDRPTIPDNYEPKELLAFGVRGKDSVFWFLCPNEDEVQSWMAAVATTLPPPPQPPQGAQMPGGGPPAPLQHPSAPPHMHPPPPQYTPGPQQPPPYVPPATPGIPGQYPPPAPYRPPPYQPQQSYNPGRPQAMVHPVSSTAPAGTTVIPGNTTVIMQDSRPGYSNGGGGGDFAMGMLLGGAIGTTWGGPHCHGIGGGWGWYSGGYGGYHGGSNVTSTDVHINNYYDNDTTIVNNNVDVDNDLSIVNQQQAPAQDGTTGDYVQEFEPPAMEDNGAAMFEESGGHYEEAVEYEDAGAYDGGYDAGADYGGDFDGGGDFGGDFGGMF